MLQPTYNTQYVEMLCVHCVSVCFSILIFFPVGVHKGILKIVDDKAMKTITRLFSGALGQKAEFMMA